MRKLAQYRRNNHPNSGFKEKVTFQLSKRPMTGRELCALFHMTLAEFNHQMRECLKPCKSISISSSDPVKVGRVFDHTYTLERKPKRLVPLNSVPIVISGGGFDEQRRKEAIIAAKRRARVIALGLNPGCLD
ncbi:MULTISPECIES: hypothetical protein [unclassified Pantoea]|uniref:hypothetical protein n=1 Tax=unclassified Pantoea TaxID=2630326 RepID=UPI001232DA31|nr:MULTISPECIES: hypothetical protein [unclassified Pantoea]KAA5932362.1 hypothetical protein F3I59_04860 [Pantoea sp. VH_8]KAA5937423.1 hypothetical protein F3I58_04890 [Pantoea sp. VH_4]